MKFFESLKTPRIRRNRFDLSHERKMTFNMGSLIPMMCMEVMPGDSFRVRSQIYLRALALVAAVMHRVTVKVEYFFCPNRLIWTNWENYITGGFDGLQAPVPPKFQVADVNAQAVADAANYLKSKSLLDYLGFPVMLSTDVYNATYTESFSSLPLRAYTLTYQQYYQDEQLFVANRFWSGQALDGVETAANISNLFGLRTSSWEKDYLTSALPNLQRGVAASVSSLVTAPTTGAASPIVRDSATGGAAPAGQNLVTGGAGVLQRNTGPTNVYLDPNGSLSSSFTINALRLANALQIWLEHNNMSGGRYIEQIYRHYGVVSPDARLQRVQYLGGAKIPMVISEVMQTAPAAGGSTPLATIAGHGMAIGSTPGFRRFFEEHGFVLGMIRVMAKTAYQNVTHKMWTRLTNTQYAFPEFAHLGEDNVFWNEAYYNAGDGGANSLAARGTTFGYQARYADYKYYNDMVSGDFRESLKFWHFGRITTPNTPPALNFGFVTATHRTDPFVSAATDVLVCQIFHDISALRPLPYFGTPSL